MKMLQISSKRNSLIVTSELLLKLSMGHIVYVVPSFKQTSQHYLGLSSSNHGSNIFHVKFLEHLLPLSEKHQ